MYIKNQHTGVLSELFYDKQDRMEEAESITISNWQPDPQASWSEHMDLHQF